MSQITNAPALNFNEADMSGTVEDMQRLSREIAEADPAPTVQRAIERVARAIGLNYRRAYGFFYGTARTVSAEEWIAAQNAVMATRRARAARLRMELAALEKSMEQSAHAENLAMERPPVGVDRRQVLGRGPVVPGQG